MEMSVEVLVKDYFDSALSRSQAKRIKKDYSTYKKIVINFENVNVVSPSFIDELFRIGIGYLEIDYKNASPKSMFYIDKALAKKKIDNK